MKTISVTLCSLLLGAAILHADESLREVQQELKDQGFYFGTVNGEAGDDTTQAIKRFQIRNGLDVTGQLNDETRSALKNGGSADDTSSSAPSVSAPSDGEENQSSDLHAPTNSAAQSDQEFLRKPAPAPAPAERGIPAISYADVFHETPYATAPSVVQRDTIRRAEESFAQMGLYRGDVDGVPGPQLQRAISEYQSRTDLEVTGRLDMDTLARLHLLPRHAPERPHVRVIIRPHAFGGVWIP